jgi:hypothetical protein
MHMPRKYISLTDSTETRVITVRLLWNLRTFLKSLYTSKNCKSSTLRNLCIKLYVL